MRLLLGMMGVMGLWGLGGCGSLALDDEGTEPEIAGMQQALRDGTPEAVGFLRFVNHAPESVLSFNFGTGGKTLGTHRRGADGIAGTADDVVYGTVAQVRGISGVGSTTMDRIEKYALGHHFADGTSEPKVADWASHLGSSVDVSVSHSMQVYEEYCHGACTKQNLRWQTYPLRFFRGRDGEHYFVMDNRHLGRLQRDGYISMTSGGSGSNPAGYADLWVYARVERLTGTSYRFTLKGYTEHLPTNTLPTKRYLLVDDRIALPLTDAP